MKRRWDEQELGEHWSLSHDEFELLQGRTEKSRIGFAAILKFFQIEGRFPSERREVPSRSLDYLAGQLDVSRQVFTGYNSEVGLRSGIANRSVRFLDSAERLWRAGKTLGRSSRDHQEGGAYNVENGCGIRITRKLDATVWSPHRKRIRLVSIS